jgi:dihydrofolate synthase / folylpolyglutamate synthase
MKAKAIKTRIFKEGEKLLPFILNSVKTLSDGDVLIISSKIVALSQGRVSSKSREELIKQESDWYLKTKYTYLSLVKGRLMKSAGLDQSNANEKTILLPEKSFQVAANLRKSLIKHFRIKNLGIIIVDSKAAFLEKGIIGSYLGYAGIIGLKSYIGQADIFKRRLKSSRVNVVASLAALGPLLMGEGNEQRPLLLISGLKVEFSDKLDYNELYVKPEEDIYGDFFREYK